MVKDIFKLMNKAINAPQYSKSLDILVRFSEYHMYTGHYFDKPKMMKDLSISRQEFDNIMCGEKSVKMSRYNQIIKYLTKYVQQAKAEAERQDQKGRTKKHVN